MFSVLISVYNHRPYLLECVGSALRSPLVTEVLLVDDGSVDGSPELFPLLQSLSARVRVLSEPSGNKGAHYRLNQLAAAASNEWLAVLNSDDVFPAARFEAISHLAGGNRADLIFGDLLLIDGDGKRLGKRSAIYHNEHPWPPNWDARQMALDGEWPPLLMLQNIMATTSNMVFTRDLHARIGGFRDYRYCHDWDFALRAALDGRLAYVPAMLTMYRIHGNNTIKEAPTRVTREVNRMFSTLVDDQPELRGNNEFTRIAMENRYLRRSREPVLAIIIADELFRSLLQLQLEAAELPVITVAEPRAVPRTAAYTYAPGPSGANTLGINDVRSLLLAIATRPYDAFLLSRSPEPAPQIGTESLKDALVLRRRSAGYWQRGAIRLMRLYSASLPTRSLSTIIDGAAIDYATHDGHVVPDGEVVAVPIQAPFVTDGRPVIFILPAFLAVGGVERLVLETMRHLADRYRFVVVATEPLRPEQGSHHAGALELGHVYDLSEIARQDDRLRAMEILADWYNPVLVWICNGAPWQISHAADIRRLFAAIPVVDQQAYDHEVGWITAFGDPGVAASDRFIAVNKKILSVMQDRYRIPPDHIDLVYHGTDMSKLRRSETSDVAAIRLRFGLDPNRPVFGMIGRLSAQKRPLDLIALAKRAPEQFIWVGLGEMEDEFKHAAKDVANITLIPGQKDLRPIYEMLDGLIVTSEFEGLPIVLLETLAMGVPVLSTDVGAIREVLDRYGSGFTYDPPGADTLVTAFQQFRADLPRYSAAAIANADEVRKYFSAERMAREYDEVFRKAIQAVRSGANRPARSAADLGQRNGAADAHAARSAAE